MMNGVTTQACTMSNQFLTDLADTADLIPNDKVASFGLLLKNYKNHSQAISTRLYEKLDQADRARFVQWFLKRWGEIDIVNPIEMHQYLQAVDAVKNQVREPVQINGRRYGLLDFAPQGHDFKLASYDWVLGIHDVYYNQYEHGDFRVSPGDVIIDAGGFIGDTAVLFCHKTQGQCEVHSFELLQENIDLFAYNNELNGIEDKVIINKFALSSKTGDSVGIKNAPLQGGTSVSSQSVHSGEEQIPTITIDDYVMMSNLSRVDLIKMDIEGSEIPALIGASNTIRLFKPKLALCLYHKWDDVLTIPSFIEATGVAYDFKFKWVQLSHGWEAVLLASPCS